MSISRYLCQQVETSADLEAAQQLRHRCFFNGLDGLDRDRFDDVCQHFNVIDAVTGKVVCCFRLLPLSGGAELGQSYCAQFYDLGRLGAFPNPMAELGRFCIDPDSSDPDILRVAWAKLTRYVDEKSIEMLFGCSSFQGTEPKFYDASFALLQSQHQAPKKWSPLSKAKETYEFADMVGGIVDRKAANRLLPSLLRTYLLMGGWVSDHAVIDRHLNTLHVFTGLEIAAIPEGRKRLLRADAGRFTA